MNRQPISHAKDPDLRFSHVALQRAAHKARELAEQTGTRLVVSHKGHVEYITPDPSFKPSEKNAALAFLSRQGGQTPDKDDAMPA